jgi:hypothetical protein
MGSPKAIVNIIDLSTSIPSFAGVRASILIPNAPFGVVGDEPIEVNDESSFLEAFSPRGRVEIGYSLAYFSALTYLLRSQSLNVHRVIKNAVYGGLRVAKDTVSTFTITTGEAVLSNTALFNIPNGQAVKYTVSTGGTAVTGLVSGNTYYVSKSTSPNVKLHVSQTDSINEVNSIVITGGTGTQSLTLVSTALTITKTKSDFTDSSNEAVLSNTALFTKLITGDVVVYTVSSGGTAMAGLVSGNSYFVRKGTSPNIKLYTTKANALADTSSLTFTGGVGTHTLTFTQQAGLADPTSYIFNDNEAILIYPSNQGIWSSNDVVIKITDNSDKETDSFYVRVYRPENINVPISGEEFLCSRKIKVDGYNKQLFVEDALKASKYIRAINNDLIADTVLPTFTGLNETLSFNGGTNGDIVTDADMITALDVFRDKDSVLMTLFMDGGWATPSFHGAIADLCATRQDCIGIGSVPISAELTASYMTDIVAYADSLTPLMPDSVAKYFTLYTSHQEIKDKFNNRDIYVSPDGFVAGVVAFTAFNYEIWYAPAGWKRAGISAQKPLRKFNEGQRDTLYDKGINCIRFHKTKGLAIWGNKNRQKRPSSLDRFNVMLLIVVLTPALQDFLDNITFDFNTPDDRRAVILNIKQYMRGIQSNKGITEFEMVDATTTTDVTNYKSKYVLAIKPTQVQEFIELSLVIVKANDSIKVSLEQL